MAHLQEPTVATNEHQISLEIKTELRDGNSSAKKYMFKFLVISESLNLQLERRWLIPALRKKPAVVVWCVCGLLPSLLTGNQTLVSFLWFDSVHTVHA